MRYVGGDIQLLLMLLLLDQQHLHLISWGALVVRLYS